MSRRQVISRSAAALAVAAAAAWGVAVWIRHSASPLRDKGSVVRPAGAPAARASADDANPTPRIPVPDERRGADDGVVDAARTFANRFVTPELKFPDSAVFPESSIRFEPCPVMNFSTGDRIEHWFVDGGVDSRNDYGVVVRARWRVMLGRADDNFFPVVVSLEGLPLYQMRGHVAMLQDARRAKQQQEDAQAAARKATELAEQRAVWQANAAAKPAEQKASEALKMARDLLDAGRHEPARRRLQEILERYPGTTAASEAEALLGK